MEKLKNINIIKETYGGASDRPYTQRKTRYRVNWTELELGLIFEEIGLEKGGLDEEITWDEEDIGGLIGGKLRGWLLGTWGGVFFGIWGLFVFCCCWG